MGFFSSLKRLFFATESVAKSAVDKGVDFAKEKSQEMVHEGKETWHKVEEKTAGLRESIAEKAGDLADKAEDIAESIGDKLAQASQQVWEKTNELAEKVSDKVMDVSHKMTEEPMVNKQDAVETGLDLSSDVNMDMPDAQETGSTLENMKETLSSAGQQAWEKTSEVAEKVGEKVVETSDKVWEKTQDFAEKVGEKVKTGGEQLWEKAKEAGAAIEQKFDETVEKAKEWEAKEAEKPKQEFSESDLTTGGSLLDGKDDFFKKASQYADGHYDAFREGKVDVTSTSTPESQEDREKKLDDLIDDAIIEKE